MIGKVDPDRLEGVFSQTGAPDDNVLVGPAYGEDTAAIRIGEQLLVVNTDPVSLAAERIGEIGVHVACNDVAASGGEPRWLTAAVFLPDESLLDPVIEQLDTAARGAGVAIVGGHTEYAPERDRPLLTLTCLGLADEYVPTGGAKPGDSVLLTKGAGIEGTAILATDFRDELDLPEPLLDRGEALFAELSVLPEARLLREDATAMHDPTEGGLIDGALELAVASDACVEIERDRVPVRDSTEKLCGAMGVDPLKIFGSGALLATIPEERVTEALDALAAAGIEAAAVGRVTEGEPALALDGERITEPVRDDLYGLWE
ncbi:AIR synthase family protein [Halalkalicoccus jeotgali]|uniref:AIR synthase related protein domain protein n=1 Tax=Halalkalicoccus jeotgali (strain DSM 18796 / CECT 7217 / JCM 14584 / KCTC 4019 / B3) TaxID=795797 RepID=D8J2H7_HALJB|nr:AIR synthase family protein [Halalkalicoccus jeotgali]ADJ14934.1 AIR synthase related protein domain protein [Halalkalicoccus jeotgali B3]ELY35050.1 AIR synthase-like protein domain-containing protein [Halalkalicoccus jeotgali B3]